MSFISKLFKPDSPYLPTEISSVVRRYLAKTEQQRPFAKGKDQKYYFIANAGLLEVTGTEAPKQICDWFEVQQAIWAGESKRLVIRWVDPQRQPLTINLADHEQIDFMRAFDERVAATIVSVVRRKAENGTNIVASIRRRADGGLFSALVVDGCLTPTGQKMASQLERSLRDSVGLTPE
ncbi:hypothetical protein HMPREF0044_0997 [Gleimia coleocanis DSM 15436]|uniref:Uncharacterized protein n=1 Tax=Gleimia coleocanis DSM 15436 TaxID=525245 RepID=C0W0B9_9ACTO|nr:hypothetical protein [Gleimia coleocanis]EEH63978.1 hypothetical protein HMPREF0044_0997 [Gleimia coleocanis DSM 15436]